MKKLFRSPGSGNAFNSNSCVFEFRTVAFLSCLVLLLSYGCKEPENIGGDNEILSFDLKSVSGTSVSIDHDDGIVNVIVPYGTVLANLTAEIELSEQATIVPSSSISQNFSKPIYYTVTSINRIKKVYKVVVFFAKQTSPVISNISKDTVRAGERLVVMGHEFGNFDRGVNVYLLGDDEQADLVNSRLVDSTKIEVGVPSDLKPGFYTIRVVKNSLEAKSSKKLLVRIPAPEISTVKSFNVLWGDSIVVAGNYIDPSLYEYKLKMVYQKHNYLLETIAKQPGKLSFIASPDITPGDYSLSLVNIKESVTGTVLNQTVRVYDNELPFVKYVQNTASGYKPGAAVFFSALKFDRLSTRFYQLELTADGKQYNQNGIYDSSQQQLGFELPSAIRAGAYKARIIFLSYSGQQLYDIELDGSVMVVE